MTIILKNKLEFWGAVFCKVISFHSSIILLTLSTLDKSQVGVETGGTLVGDSISPSKQVNSGRHFVCKYADSNVTSTHNASAVM